MGLHDYELIELLLTYAIPRMDVKPLAKLLLKRHKGLRGILDATPSVLMETPGLGQNASVLIGLIKELGKAYLKEDIISGDVLSSPKKVLDFLTMELAGERVEKFIAIFLNTKNEVIALETLNEGTLNRTAVYPRKVIEYAFKHNARSIIFVHNHPSGNHTPSKEDLKLTRDLEIVARGVDILVHDHIIIGKKGHTSLKDFGWPR